MSVVVASRWGAFRTKRHGCMVHAAGRRWGAWDAVDEDAAAGKPNAAQMVAGSKVAPVFVPQTRREPLSLYHCIPRALGPRTETLDLKVGP